MNPLFLRCMSASVIGVCGALACVSHVNNDPGMTLLTLLIGCLLYIITFRRH